MPKRKAHPKKNAEKSGIPPAKAQKLHSIKTYLIPKAILLKDRALALWSKLPPSKWVRGAVAAAGAILILSLPAMAILGGQGMGDLKLPSEKNSLPEFDDRVLSVIQATPEGKISLGDERKEVFVVFSHPVVPLATLDEVTKGAFTVAPKVKGRFRWYGSRICAFVPDEDWQQGAEYKVTINSDTEAVTGQKLKQGKAFRFKMEVPPLAVEDLSSEGYSKLKYNAKFSVTFNFPVTAAALKEKLSLKENGSDVAFEIREVEPNEGGRRRRRAEGRTWKIVPGGKFSKAAQIVLRIEKGLKAKGLLTDLPQPYERKFETYGDLTLDFGGEASSWEERYRMQFTFSNPVNAKTAAKAISFSPAVKSLWLPQGEVTELGITSWNVQPGKKYKITVTPFNDVLGNRLKEGASFEAALPDRESFFQRVESGSVIEAEMQQNYPLNVSNMQSLTATVRPFTLDDVLSFTDEKDDYSLHEFLRRKGGGKTTEFKTLIKHNGIGRSAFNLAPYLDKGRGWMYAEFFNGKEKEKDRATVNEAIQATDIGITARPALGGNHIWLHSLGSGNPIEGGKVQRYTMKKRDGECTTNAEGYCLLAQGGPREEGDTLTYAAAKGNDKAFVTSKEQRLSISPGNGSFAHNITGAKLDGIIVFDRKLHTPGDKVYFKAVLTQKKGDKFSALANVKVEAEVSNAEGKSIYSKTIKTSAQGGAAGELEIPKDAPLGHYTLSFTEKDEFGNQHVQDNFQIEEFRPVNFAVAVTGVHDAVSGDELSATIEGKYLFGAPMQAARFQVDVTRTKFTPTFDNYPDFNFGDQKYSYYGESEETDTGFFTGQSGRLEANGKFGVKIPLDAMVANERIDQPEKKNLRLASPYRVSVEATIKDVDDKAVSNRQGADVAAGKSVVGIRAKDRYAKTGDDMQFEIVALNPEGKSAGTVPVKVSILHVTWKSVRTQAGDEAMQTKNSAVRRLVTTETVKASNKPATFSFKPDKSGEYYILAQAEGELGFARTGFYASGESDGFFMRDDDTVSMVADRPKYKPGDTAKIVIQSPVKTGRIILSLEREKVYWQKQVEIKDYAISVPVEIKEEYLPNVYLTALIVKPREKLSKRTVYEDLGAPAFKIGSLSLAVDPGARRARFQLSYDRPQYGPGDTVKIAINTESDAEIALSVADRAVLDLVNYHFADPIANFFSSWPLAIELFENRHAIIHQYDFAGKGNTPGGGPGEPGEGSGSGGFSLDSEAGTRKNFRYTAFWKSDIKANKEGKAEVTFKLPDNLSTFRIMALAAADGKYTDYEKEFQVRKALVVQPLMPRFIRPGDELAIGAVVINQTGEAGDFTVDLKADLLAGAASKTVTIAAGEAKEVAFSSKLNIAKYAALIKAHREKPADVKAEKPSEHPILLSGFVTAKPVAAEALVAKGFKAADLIDRVKIEFPVLESPVAEAFAIAGFTDKKAEEAVVIPASSDVLGNLGSLDVTLSSTALVGLDKAFHFYGLNPYFCLEQRASAFQLAITAGELLKSFAVRPTTSDNYDFAQIERLFLGELDEFVNADGGLIAWKRHPHHAVESNPYLSAYVLTVLQLAETKKYSVKGSIRSGIVKYLDKFLRTELKGGKHWMLETLALVNLALAREGEYRKDLTKFLLKNEEFLSVRAKARVALAIAVKEKLRSYKDDSDTKRLIEFFKSRLEVTTTSVMIKELANREITQAYYSPTSALALVLQVFVMLDKENPLIPQMVNHLLQTRSGYDTHSIGLMAASLEDYRNTYETSGQPFSFQGDVTLGGKKILSQSMASNKLDVFRKSLNMIELKALGEESSKQPFVFAKGGDRGRLYYTARLNYSPLKLAGKARDEGIEIHRNLFSIESVDGRQVPRKIKGNKLKRGELYLQKLMVTTPKPYYNVVIVDPLASQTEVMNAAFQTEKTGSARVSERSGRAEDDEHSEGEMQVRASEDYYYGSRPTRLEYRHDKVVMFFDYIPPGFHEYRYIIRPVVRGKGAHPPGQAKVMYEPEIFGRSASGQTQVE